ncbi:DUF4974 domain-containing protein [Arenibacter aquaticus]|uniref:DUF4974 domain-containing protein n=1 Tax=Arenibacter aquaticus TaxID=2489054 RepID=A0A3S0CNT4_9FLAO|nr:FecR family protein [Arenibacter aquaticus]RTE53781.1 DUF4974 domain-containing protein [Arenibacter aquaticus]
MISEEIEKLIIKFLNRSSNSEELDVLNNWIGEEGNYAIFKDYVKTHYAITLAMNDPDLNKLRKQLQKEIRKDKNVFYGRRYAPALKYAAIAIIFLGIGVLIKSDILINTPKEAIQPRSEAIQLVLDNGQIEIISGNGASLVKDSKGKVIGSSNGNKLVYQDVNEIKELSFNTLSVPNGKQFTITLSDGTNVHLNAGSSLRYPVSFLEGKQREVFLMGEAYFDVAHSDQNPFIVSAQNLDILVHGTKFNVSNYPEDRNTEVVLLDGSVSLTESKGPTGEQQEEVFLKPGFKGVYNKSGSNISKQEVNTSIYTSWMKGNLVFRDVAFENIIQKLERHYNVVIINNNAKLATETFNATIETKHETIEQVFNYFNKVYQIEYQILDNKIIIN